MKALPSIVMMLLLTAGAAAQQSAEPPSWARGLLWYLLLPDRFHNGDRENDPKAADVFGDPTVPWQVSEWTANWYAQTVEERMLHENFYPSALLRQYGGDFDGLLARLDYLDSLGAEGIILTPIFEAVSSHKFDVSSLHHADRHFGPFTPLDTTFLNREKPEDARTWYMTSADRRFAELVSAIHARGMRVLIMAQFAHVSVHFWAFEDLLRRQETSAYGSWFNVLAWDRPETPYESEFRYDRMWGIDAFPRFRQDTLGLVAGPRDYVFASTRRWMDPNGDGNFDDGVDGWCIDLADALPLRFWQDWARHCRTINPEVLLVNLGKGWGRTAAPFDMDQPRDVAQALSAYFLGRTLTPTALDARMMAQRSRTTLSGSDMLLTMIGSHETDRIASMCVNDSLAFDEANSPRSNAGYLARPPDESDRRLQRMLLLLQFTLPGAPLMYYGDEAGMWGGDDPDNRKPMLWPEMDFLDERSFAVTGDPARYPVRFDSSMYAFYRQLIALRENSVALRSGTMQTLQLDDVSGLYVFMRAAGAEKIFVAVNAGDNSRHCVLPYLGLPEGVRLVDPVNGVSFYSRRDQVSFVLPPRTVSLLIPDLY
ncbi:MAG: alpha-amylase family glycosyl hydrolase [Bacteroidota bacterium]|nr:alpha-amylase family glycosyl hydrolase [Bacteroidota bacterium]